MALLKCPECGGNVSDKADCCPHCGYIRFKQEKKVDYVSSKEKNKYIGMTEEELNSLIEQYIAQVYPQLFGKDMISQKEEYLYILEDIFEALGKINSKSKLLLMERKYAKVPYLHLALYLSTSQYLAISKRYLENVINTITLDEYKEIGLHLEVMADDFGEVLVLEENYDKFLEFSSIYHKIRFKEKESIQGDYIIYQYGSSINDEHQLCNTHTPIHLGDCRFVDKEMKPNTIERIVYDSPITNKQPKVNFAKRAAIGGIVGGTVGAIVGVASGIDKNSKVQNSNTINYHIEYKNDDSYILSLTSNIVFGVKFSFLINENRTNYVKFDNVVYEKMDELYIVLKKKMLLAQRYRQQMYAWVKVFNNINGFKENSDKALECLKSYNDILYKEIIEEINEKENARLEEKEKRKNQYLLSIEKKEKIISEWQDKYEIYKNKKFGEGKKMKEYCRAQLEKYREEEEELKESLAKLERDK